eukprot:g24217.t1
MVQMDLTVFAVTSLLGKGVVQSLEVRVNVEPDQLKRFHRHFSSSMSEDASWLSTHGTLRPNVLFDSSGSNSQWLARRLETARHAGYQTELLWVDVPVEIALWRNRNRAKSKGQWCPECIIMEKSEDAGSHRAPKRSNLWRGPTWCALPIADSHVAKETTFVSISWQIL